MSIDEDGKTRTASPVREYTNMLETLGNNGVNTNKEFRIMKDRPELPSWANVVPQSWPGLVL